MTNTVDDDDDGLDDGALRRRGNQWPRTILDPMDAVMVDLCCQRVRLEAEREEILRLLERKVLRIHEAALELWDDDHLEKIGGRH